MTKSGKHCGKRKMCNFFFCHYVFKKPSAAEASESVYMRERVKIENIVAKKKLLIKCNFFICFNIFKSRLLCKSGKGLQKDLQIQSGKPLKLLLYWVFSCWWLFLSQVHHSPHYQT